MNAKCGGEKIQKCSRKKMNAGANACKVQYSKWNLQAQTQLIHTTGLKFIKGAGAISVLGVAFGFIICFF
jgi:hypothetical protein